MAIIRESNGDARADTGTQYSIPVGNDFLGRLSSTGDTDWVRVELVTGTIYDIILDGVESARLLLFDSAGSVVARGSNFGSYTKLKVFSPDASGTYYISIDSTADNFPSDYEISLDLNPIRTAGYDEIADYLTGGSSFPRGFDVEPGGTLTANITALDEAGRQLARLALEAWTGVSGIEFEFVEGDYADITFDDMREEGELSAYASRTISAGHIVNAHINIPAELLDRYGTGLDDHSFYLYLHEIGHALGLNHPGPYDASEPSSIDKIFLNDSWQATVMSYFHQEHDNFVNASFARPVTPMSADIIALQNIYGKPGDINTGDTVYGYGASVDGYLDDVFARWTGETDNAFEGPITLTLYDNDGSDTLDLHTDATDQQVDLRPEGISDVYGLVGNLVIAPDTLIEDFIAGAGNDTVTGNEAANRLEGRGGDDELLGNGGDDVLTGGAGADRLLGGTGEDTVTYLGSDAGVTVKLRDGAGTGGHAEGDVLNGIEHLTGSDHADAFGGDSQNNRLSGMAGDDGLWASSGDDILEGGAGADRMHGNIGEDTASYESSDAGVTVRLHSREANGGHAEGDTFTGFITVDGTEVPDIEHLTGSAFDDTLAGDLRNNVLKGGAGDDTLYGGPDGGDDRMYGESGNDRVFGGKGDDMIAGGAGDDTLHGGPDNDTFVIAPGGGTDTIMDFTSGEDRIDLSAFAAIATIGDLTLEQQEENLVIDLADRDGGSIILQGFDIAGLDAHDFIF